MDHVTGQPIADDLYDSKDSTTIKEFLEKHLDPNQQIFVVTDIANGYTSTFKGFSGKNVIHQLCLLHLNKLIIKDFPKRTTMEEEITKYKLLNIFYNIDNEIEFLKKLAEEEKIMKQKNNKGYLKWLKKQRYLFKRFLHDLELKRRRERQNLEQRSYEGASEFFDDLMDDFYTFSTPVRNEDDREELEISDSLLLMALRPPTIENYYSTSLKQEEAASQ